VSVLETLLRRERAVVCTALAVLLVLAWGYLWQGAGMGMTVLDMTSLALFPHTQPEPMPGMAPPVLSWLTIVAMWWVMMVAMMTPSAAPLVLLYGRVVRHATSARQTPAAYASPLLLIGGYLVVWHAFSLAAATLQLVLVEAGLISRMVLWSKSALLSASVLILAGLYQLSPLKRVCLARCRGPVEFLTRNFRPGRYGAFVMGLKHGMWCVGCCWSLMLLLFVGGVMNIVWIVLLALFVLVEKLFPNGETVGKVGAVILIAWGAITLMR